MNSLLVSALLAAPAALAASAPGLAADHVALLQNGLAQPALKHTLRCAKGSNEGAEYLVEAPPGARGKGLGYYFSKSLRDKDLRTLAHWGSVVKGVDAGEGWLRVGECFLPLMLEGKPALKLVGKPAAAAPPAAGAARPAAAPAAMALAARAAPAAAAGKPAAAGAPAAQAAVRPPMPAAARPAAPAALKPAAPAAALFAPGEAVEMWSQKVNHFWAAVVTGKGKLPNTFSVRIPTAPKERREVPDVPQDKLRRPPGVTLPLPGFVAGEDADFKISTNTGSWSRCVIQARGSLPNTYDIYVPEGQQGHVGGAIADVPAAWLRRRAPEGDVAAALNRLSASYEEIERLFAAEAQQQGS